MNILFVSSEVEPFSKSGGLGDVAGALPYSLAALGNNVMVVTPRYLKLRKPVGYTGIKIKVPIGKAVEEAELFEAEIPSVGDDSELSIVFIGNDKYFGRDEYYGTQDGDYPDNHRRFAFFARAVLEAARAKKFKPDIIHLNDWQCALTAVYLRAVLEEDEFFANTKILLTIHNLGYQGLFKKEVIAELGLPESLYRAEALEYWGKVNFLKGGIIFSDAINTVSRRYAQEIQTVEFGVGFEGILRKRADRLFGILNGVDYPSWNPDTDKLIAANYSPDDLSGKEICKRDLLAQYNMPYSPERPVIGMISRLTIQKGFDLVEEALDDLMIRDAQLVILGTGEKKYQDLLKSVMDRYPGKLGIKLAYDNAIAHKIEAGCDMFLMPSKYEPCGLNQMYSLKYGTPPVVRATGGLDDTIVEWDAKETGNGFKFSDYTVAAMMAAIDRALKAFPDKSAWAKIVQNGMAKDHSWEASAREYIALYNTMKRF